MAEDSIMFIHYHSQHSQQSNETLCQQFEYQGVGIILRMLASNALYYTTLAGTCRMSN